MKPLVLLPEAVRDIAEAHEWYERRKPGLGQEFVERVEACLVAIRENLGRYGFAYQNYRRAKVRRFPYVVFYLEGEQSVRVYSVFHCARDPREWRRRLG